MKRCLLALCLVSSLVAPVAYSQETTPKKPKSKPQSQLALKSAFPMIKATDPKVKGAHPATDLVGAKKLIGKTANVVGTVATVYMPKSNNLVLLNFAKDYKTALVGAVMSKDYAKFPSLAQLKGKKVLLTGKVVMFKGAPEVELDKAGAISIVK